LIIGGSETGGLEIRDWSVVAFDAGFDSIPWRKSQVSPRMSKPAQREGPERRARPAKTPARVSRWFLHIPQAKSRNVTASIVPLAWRDNATRPGSMARRNARIRAGRGLILSLKT
jgi:hypothetical protein